MQLPSISVVVCTYNGERFLEEQLQSILNQTYPNFNVIIVDDCSTDNTKKILQRYEEKENCKVYYNSVNKGFLKNFEYASTLATGDLISFSDQDDIWLPQKLTTLQHSIGFYSLVYSNSILIDEQGKSLNKKLSDFRLMKDVITDTKGFVFHNVVSGHSMMIKKELLQIALPIPGNSYHDWWFAIQAANLHGIIYVDEPLTYYRQHTTTVTKTIVDKKVGTRKAEKRYHDYIKDLRWIETFVANPYEKNKDFFNKLYQLYLSKKRVIRGNFSFFYLNMKNLCFNFSKKKYTSKLIEIRKMARSEKKPSTFS